MADPRRVSRSQYRGTGPPPTEPPAGHGPSARTARVRAAQRFTMADAIGHWATPEVVTCGPGGAKSEAEAAVLNEILVALHRVGVGRRDAVVAMAALAGDLPDAELGVGDPLDQWRWHLRASAPVAGPGPTLSA